VRYLYTKLNPDWHCETYITKIQKETEHFKTHLLDQISQVDQFILTLTTDPEARDTFNLPHDETIGRFALYQKFRDVMSKLGRKEIITATRFGREIKKVTGVTPVERFYKFDYDLTLKYLQEKQLLE
jgi:hypothetical protein